MKRVAVALLVIVALAGGVLFSRQRTRPAAKADEPAGASAEAPAPVSVQMATAEHRTVEATLSAQGTLAPAQGASAKVAPAVAGKLSEVRVREGERVAAGQVVAVIENQPQQQQARSAESALAASQAQARQSEIAADAAATDQANAVRAAKLAVDSARTDRDNAVQQAKTALAAAETDLRKTRAGARPQEVAQAEQAVAQAKATRDRAETELQRQQFLFEKGISAKRQVEDARTALSVADAGLETARQQVSLLKAGARTEDVQAAELRVQQAQEAVAQAKTSGDAKLRLAQAALTQAEQGALQVAARRQDAVAAHEVIFQKQADLGAARATAGYAVVRAPISGLVTRRAQNPGDMADPSAAIVEIANTGSLDLLANLPADAAAQLRPGMIALVTTEQSHGFPSTGRVASVGQVDPQTNLLGVRISVVNSAGKLKIGTFATAQITVRTDANAVVVPKEAVLAKESGSVVFIVGPDNVAHERKVSTGVEQGGVVEILSGVNAGARVVKLGNYELSDGAKVQPQPAGGQGSGVGGQG